MSTYVLIGLYVLLALAAVNLWLRETKKVAKRLEERDLLDIGMPYGEACRSFEATRRRLKAIASMGATFEEARRGLAEAGRALAAASLYDGEPEEDWRRVEREHDSWNCPIPECEECGVRDCPGAEPLHYHHDGCPYCDLPYNERWR
jgi:hypothetical protein